jgi:hypothetical protein
MIKDEGSFKQLYYLEYSVERGEKRGGEVAEKFS